MKTLLAIDDDLGIQKQLKWSLTDYEVVFAEDRSVGTAANFDALNLLL